jgi:formylglycine-generating enzyme required for sulfatase activity
MDSRPLKVFLCHAHPDADKVRALYARLKADGVDAWLDAESLIPGQNWQVEIPKAIRESDVVIVCLSEKSINKEGYVQKEIKSALDVADEKPEGTIFIIPARLEECKTPDRLNLYHWVDLYEEYGYQRLMRALQTRADKIGVVLQSHKNSRIKPDIGESTIRKTPSAQQHESTKNLPIPQETVTASKPKRRLNIAIVIIVVVVTALSLFSFWFIKNVLTNLISVPTATTTSLLAEITDDKGVPMSLIPAGEFNTIYLDAYYMDKYEVTDASYKLCVDNGVCLPPKIDSSSTRSIYYGEPQFNNYPVINVDWSMATTYCQWRDGQIPTQNQWEKAANGTDDRVYPWGKDIDSTYANYNTNIGDTTAVGSYEKGKSPYGLYDMAGNVAEMTAEVSGMSTFNEQHTPTALGAMNISLGGSWSHDAEDLKFGNVVMGDISAFGDFVGFRCARDATP